VIVDVNPVMGFEPTYGSASSGIFQCGGVNGTFAPKLRGVPLVLLV